MSEKQEGFATLAVHAGQDHRQWKSGAVVPPIVASSTFGQHAPAQPFVPGMNYSRSLNPTRSSLETALAALENGKYALTFSSGMATIMSITHALMSAGDHIVISEDAYEGTGEYFREIASKFGIERTAVDGTNVASVMKGIKAGQTKIVWLETPSNPCLRLTDIKAVSDELKKHHPEIILVFDNTFMSSYFQRPLDLGADISMQSLTKYMNGHTDVIMGCMVTNREDIYTKLKFVQYSLGAVPSAFDCFLVNRGLKTLHLRMEAHSKNGMAVARFLESHPKIKRVLYPGLTSHPQHQLFLRQNPKGSSGMIAVYLKSNDPGASRKFVSLLRVFILATSLGGPESLVMIPSYMSYASYPPELLERLGVDKSLIRMSTGIEDINDLISDLDQALNQL